MILNLKFCLFPPATVKSCVAACSCLAPQNGIIPQSCSDVIITPKNYSPKKITFCLCITVNCLTMPLPSKPLRHTMPNDDEEAQRLVEEVCWCLIYLDACSTATLTVLAADCSLQYCVRGACGSVNVLYMCSVSVFDLYFFLSVSSEVELWNWQTTTWRHTILHHRANRHKPSQQLLPVAGEISKN